MADNRPRGRKRNVTGQGKGVHLRGEGLGTGPVGSGSVPHGGGSPGGGGGQRNGRGMGGLPLIIVIIIALLGGGGSLSGLLGGGSSSSGGYSSTGNSWNVDENYTPSSSNSNFNYYQSNYSGNGSLSSGWVSDNATQTGLDSEVASGSREKFTRIKGGGEDVVTIMVYMCGTDLESRSGMGTSDLQ